MAVALTGNSQGEAQGVGAELNLAPLGYIRAAGERGATLATDSFLL